MISPSPQKNREALPRCCRNEVKGLCSAERLDEIDALLSKLVADRPQVG